jgi:hypothetical protein
MGFDIYYHTVGFAVVYCGLKWGLALQKIEYVIYLLMERVESAASRLTTMPILILSHC